MTFLGIAAILLLRNVFRADIVSILLMLALGFGILTPAGSVCRVLAVRLWDAMRWRLVLAEASDVRVLLNEWAGLLSNCLVPEQGFAFGCNGCGCFFFYE